MLKALRPAISDTGIIGAITRRTCRRVARDLFDKFTEEGRTLSPNSRAGNYAPKLFGQRPREEREGFKKAEFVLAIEQLLSDRVLRVTDHGRSAEKLVPGPRYQQPESE